MGIKDKRLSDIVDPIFIEMMKRVGPYSMHANNGDIENIYAWYRDIHYILKYNIPGAIVECGVWRGGMMMLAALIGEEVGERRDLWLYDTFAGVTEPTIEDGFEVNRTYHYWKSKGDAWGFGGSMGKVSKNMGKTGYQGWVGYVKGDVLETIPKSVPNEIAALRIDVDLYRPTKHCLEHLYPLLSVGGVLVLDDYGCFDGARQAVDDYIEKSDLQLLLSRVGRTVYEATKQKA